VDAQDLTLDGGATVTGVTVLGSQQVRFHLSVPQVDGTYTYTLAADSLLNLQGHGNLPYQGTFSVDTVGPRVVGQVPELIAPSPFTQLTFVFDEPIDPASFTTADVTRFTGPGGVDLRPQLTGVTVTGQEATIHFNGQSSLGTYIFQVGPFVEDLVGNTMDQNANGTPGEPGDFYFTTVDVQSVDLVADQLDAPATAQFGDTIGLSWVVRNIGTQPATNAWTDGVWLSSDATLDGSDTLLLTVDAVTVPLAGGQQYTQQTDAVLPLTGALPAGDGRHGQQPGRACGGQQ